MQKNEQKNKGFVKLLVLLVLVAATVAAFVFTNELFGEQSVFNRSISENDFVNALYHKIPALIRSVQIVTVAWILSWLLQLVMRKGFARSNRAVTIVKLLESFIKWVIAIVAIMMVLHAWGVDTVTLLASAGILTLIIGLGAESLVADILAGIFMVFEGEFQVGDIVIINDWRGTVQEIGIRTTKIVDAGGNINIVNNSEITTVINQTQEISQASVTVGIEYGESLPRVEIVIRDNLETIKEHIPAIIDGPYYKGGDRAGRLERRSAVHRQVPRGGHLPGTARHEPRVETFVRRQRHRHSLPAGGRQPARDLQRQDHEAHGDGRARLPRRAEGAVEGDGGRRSLIHIFPAGRRGEQATQGPPALPAAFPFWRAAESGARRHLKKREKRRHLKNRRSGGI